MPHPTDAFFSRLAERGTVPELERTTGTLRVDVERDGKVDHWRVETRRGAVAVSRSDAEADLVLTASGRLFDDLASGQANALASTLRGELGISGDPAGLVRFQRLFPPPTGRKMKTSARTVGKRRG
jgi:predicted lipid carrier protein YhbT